ncbi:M14 family metallopeptidase [Kordiimonas laminariae]|uniref:M14 family metallopeptidase n=1 Tax=Kordiimonas laminariae TaxID=2917717 RepID=UPI001FF1C466|nr:M14-type cytosolic carboxypeptidase [Kordiimonas laminariae]MCK0068373.1 M14-type cytosolic carboxypeptidase [Kordiimonas laminariae]
MLISSAFDSGNIEIIKADDPSDVRLAIRKDNNSDFYQWFHFRVSGVEDTPCKLTIENAGGAAYAEGWEEYKVCASYDRESWFRIETEYDGTALSWEIEPEQDSLYFAYFAPFSMERHSDMVAEVSDSPLVSTSVLGHTLDGQDLDLVEIGYGPEGRKKVWLIARQHPGESMAEWWMEGAFDYLLDQDNPVATALLEKCHFYIVPNMNPDGSKRGHLRTNAAGANLNREWANPSMDRSPEVYLVREKMAETGVDFHLDVHGDEALPYNFIAGFEGIPSLTEKQMKLLKMYQDLLCIISPDFQQEFGYDVDAPGSADMKKCTDYVAETHGCLAMTLEMPFKDNDDLPDPEFGWSPQRCRHLARACIDTLHHMADEL